MLKLGNNGKTAFEAHSSEEESIHLQQNSYDATNIENLQSLPSAQSLSSLGPQVTTNFTKQIPARVRDDNIFLVTAGKN